MTLRGRPWKTLALAWGMAIGATSLAFGQADTSAAIIARVEADIPQTITSQRSRPHPLVAAMAMGQIPGVSVAVFRDGQLAWAKAWGVGDVTTRTPITPATLFQAASISKPVAALGAMRLVHSGVLELDTDISKSIAGWQVSAPITLRQLLSHSAGLGVSGFKGYEVGKPLPTALQILGGLAPANSAAVGLIGQPGVEFNYSGGGYTVVQALMSQATQKPFEHLMQDLVLAPLGMTESTFAQPLPASQVQLAAKGHQQGALVTGGYNIYPERAAAGLWTTPRDLGKIALEVQAAARGGGRGVVTPIGARQMLTPQIGGYGLGFNLDTTNGQAIFSHRGLNEGFETYLVASEVPDDPATVIVVMTNGQGGSSVASGLVRAIAREYDWQAFAPRRVTEVVLSRQHVASFEGLYRAGDTTIALEMLDGVLHVRDGNWMRAPVIATGKREFSVQNRTMTLAMSVAPTPRSPLQMTVADGGNIRIFTRTEGPFEQLGDQVPRLRGSMNGWGDGAAFIQTGPVKWTLSVPLEAGTYEFKIASADWTRLNLGAALGDDSTLANQTRRLSPMGDNLKLTVTRSGNITFEIDARDQLRASLRTKAGL